jgi:hypothetical protein
MCRYCNRTGHIVVIFVGFGHLIGSVDKDANVIVPQWCPTRDRRCRATPVELAPGARLLFAFPVRYVSLAVPLVTANGA